MRPIEKPLAKKLLLVCTNTRSEKEACANDVPSLRDELKAAIKGMGLPVRTVATSCLGECLSGPTVVLMPDNLWFGEVCIDDIPKIVGMVEAICKSTENAETSLA